MLNFVQYLHWDYQVNIHAIGDRANRAAVNAFEKFLGTDCNGCNHERRLRIEHAQIIVSLAMSTI
jgi:predicted amidohydrolase YtcJ